MSIESPTIDSESEIELASNNFEKEFSDKLDNLFLSENAEIDFEVPAVWKSASIIRNAFDSILKNLDGKMSEDKKYGICLTINEKINNVLEHGCELGEPAPDDGKITNKPDKTFNLKIKKDNNKISLEIKNPDNKFFNYEEIQQQAENFDKEVKANKNIDLDNITDDYLKNLMHLGGRGTHIGSEYVKDLVSYKQYSDKPGMSDTAIISFDLKLNN